MGVENTKDVNEKVLASMMVGRDVLFDKMENTEFREMCRLRYATYR